MKKLVGIFDNKYEKIHQDSCDLVRKVDHKYLFSKFNDQTKIYSFGEYILRSAGAVEQTFGGITTRLWDDPFEWTLREEISNKEKMIEYIYEVEATRKKGFALFSSDKDLVKEIPAPDEMTSLFELLLDTIIKAETLYDKAYMILQLQLEQNL